MGRILSLAVSNNGVVRFPGVTMSGATGHRRVVLEINIILEDRSIVVVIALLKRQIFDPPKWDLVGCVRLAPLCIKLTEKAGCLRAKKNLPDGGNVLPNTTTSLQ